MQSVCETAYGVTSPSVTFDTNNQNITVTVKGNELSAQSLADALHKGMMKPLYGGDFHIQRTVGNGLVFQSRFKVREVFGEDRPIVRYVEICLDQRRAHGPRELFDQYCEEMVDAIRSQRPRHELVEIAVRRAREMRDAEAMMQRRAA